MLLEVNVLLTCSQTSTLRLILPTILFHALFDYLPGNETVSHDT